MIKVFVGTPENDRLVEIPPSMTVNELLQQENITVNGRVAHNGNTIDNRRNDSLECLGVVDNDTIHVIRKLDSA